MALHRVKLPKSGLVMLRVVVLIKRLLEALSSPTLNAATVNTSWVQTVWPQMDGEWVQKFCLGGQEARIQSIAQASPAARLELCAEFCRQNRVEKMIAGGGDFKDLSDIPGIDAQLAGIVKEFFKKCYKLLSHDTRRGWKGYEFNGGRSVTNRTYKEDFCNNYPAKVVCPYCDGDIGTPELDHYLFKSGFPLLALSPWNLVPVCSSCNNVITGKGDRPAITLGPPRTTSTWLHPFFAPATSEVKISLNGSPQDSIPQLVSPDPDEQERLDNHVDLIQTLAKRWTNKAAAYHDVIVTEVSRKIRLNPVSTIDSIVQERLVDHQESCGKTASSMIHAAVCQAILDQRPGYIEEFTDSNAPMLD
ncbi:MAG: HNH endonuclease signature motif containing protein [Desulforhopalus sp.]